MNIAHFKIEIAWPAKELFRYVCDIENNCEWQDQIESAAWANHTDQGKGSVFHEIRNGQSILQRVTEFIPNQRRVTKMIGNLTIVEFEFISLGEENALLSVMVTNDVKGMFENMENDLFKLKNILEDDTLLTQDCQYPEFNLNINS